MSCQAGAYFAKTFHRTAMAASQKPQRVSAAATQASTSMSTLASSKNEESVKPVMNNNTNNNKEERHKMFETYDDVHEGWEDWFFLNF